MATVQIIQDTDKSDPGIGHLINTFRSARSTPPDKVARALDLISKRLDRLYAVLGSEYEVDGLDATLASITPQAPLVYTLSAASTEIGGDADDNGITVPTPRYAGDRLPVWVQQDSGAIRQITWNALVKGAITPIMPLSSVNLFTLTAFADPSNSDTLTWFMTSSVLNISL